MQKSIYTFLHHKSFIYSSSEAARFHGGEIVCVLRNMKLLN